MVELRDEDRQYIERVGDGSFDRGIHRLIRYARAMRHELRGVQHGLTVQAAILRRDGNTDMADLLDMSVEQISDIVRSAGEVEA